MLPDTYQCTRGCAKYFSFIFNRCASSEQYKFCVLLNLATSHKKHRISWRDNGSSKHAKTYEMWTINVLTNFSKIWKFSASCDFFCFQLVIPSATYFFHTQKASSTKIFTVVSSSKQHQTRKLGIRANEKKCFNLIWMFSRWFGHFQKCR